MMIAGRNPKRTLAASSPPIAYVVDDDDAVREALSSLFRSVGLHVKLFASASEFQQSERPETPGCLVLDIRLPGVGGLDFQDDLAKSGIHMPIVFITGHGDIPMSVRAMKAGAIDFLTKPIREQDMLDAVFAALESDRKRWKSDQATAAISAVYQTLTSREKETMLLVTKGLMNKQIANEMGLSQGTVKTHRANAMRKMTVRTVADLVRVAERLGLRSADRE